MITLTTAMLWESEGKKQLGRMQNFTEVLFHIISNSVPRFSNVPDLVFPTVLGMVPVATSIDYTQLQPSSY
jgi:hypothetical protein